MGKARECSGTVKKYTTEQTGIVLMNFDFLFQFFSTLTLMTLCLTIYFKKTNNQRHFKL